MTALISSFDWDTASFGDVAEFMAEHLPEGWEIEPCFESGAFSILVIDPNSRYHAADDFVNLDSTPTGQLKEAFDWIIAKAGELS